MRVSFVVTVEIEEQLSATQSGMLEKALQSFCKRLESFGDVEGRMISAETEEQTLQAGGK